MLDALKQQVCQANLDLVSQGLVTLTWGNVSGLDADTGYVVIKPSGVDYAGMKPEHMVVVDMAGKVVEGDLKPSSDTATHLCLYRHFKDIRGIVHTHSHFATVFAQARHPIPCMGTTHADHFMGEVPVTRPLTKGEVDAAYETRTGDVIVECFAGLNPLEMPSVLVAGHAPFTWGKSVAQAVDNAVALEAVARLVFDTLRLQPDAPLLESYVLDRHYQRKHGPGATYGQTSK